MNQDDIPTDWMTASRMLFDLAEMKKTGVDEETINVLTQCLLILREITDEQ